MSPIAPAGPGGTSLLRVPLTQHTAVSTWETFEGLSLNWVSLTQGAPAKAWLSLNLPFSVLARGPGLESCFTLHPKVWCRWRGTKVTHAVVGTSSLAACFSLSLDGNSLADGIDVQC